MGNVVRIEDLAEHVVKETLRQIRNGQVKLKKLCIDTEPEIEINFDVTVAIPNGINAIQRLNSTATKQVTEQGEQVTLDTGKTVQTTADTGVETPELKDVTEQNSNETQKTTDVSTKNFGRTNVVESEYEI